MKNIEQNQVSQKPTGKFQVFISYSHRDEKWKNLLRERLKSLQAEGASKTLSAISTDGERLASLQAGSRHIPFEIWDDSNLKPGDDWTRQIVEVRNQARVAIQLISEHYLQSETLRSEELPHLLKLQAENNLRLIPILVERCAWQSVEWLARLQILPRHVTPLADLKPSALSGTIEEIAQEIQAVIDKMASSETNRIEQRAPSKSDAQQIWLVAADPEYFDWKGVFISGKGFFITVYMRKINSDLHKIQQGDSVLAYSTLGDYILGIGQITTDPIESDDKQGHKVEFYLKVNQRFNEGVTLDELQQAVPDSSNFISPEKFTTVTLVPPADWAVIHALIVHHNPSLPIAELPPVTVSPLQRIEIEAITSSYGGTSASTFESWQDSDYTPLVPGKDITVVATLRNRGNTTWNASENFEINCNWWKEGVSSSKSQQNWNWIYALSKNVPPGHEEKITYTARIPDEPGKYRTRWSAKGVNWPAEAGLATKIFRVAVGELSRQVEETGQGTGDGNLPSGTGPGHPISEQINQTENRLPNQKIPNKRPSSAPINKRPGRARQRQSASQAAPSEEPDSLIPPATPTPLALPALPPQIQFDLTRPLVSLASAINAKPASEKTIRVMVTKDTVSMFYDDKWHLSPNRLEAAALATASLNNDEYGELLFQGIIHDQVLADGGYKSMRDGYKSAVEQAQGELRFELLLSDPALHQYKWEYLRDPNDEARPLAAYEKSPFYRRVGNVQKKAVAADPLKILAVICNPLDLGQANGKKLKPELAKLVPLDVAQESDIIKNALIRLQAGQAVEYKILAGANGPAATLEALTQELQNGYHILHLVSHGLFLGGKYFLVMEDENRQIKLEEANRFEQAVAGGDLRLIVLAACQSATIGTSDALTGLGPNLVGEKIPAVIAMQDVVRIDTAQRFSQHFYDALARTGCVDMAMAAARFAIYQAGAGKESQWGIPVLFMSTDDGELFQVNKQKVDPKKLPLLQEAEIKSYPDLTPQKLARALEAEARRYEMDNKFLQSLQTLTVTVAKNPLPAAAPSESTPSARPQDRKALNLKIPNVLQLQAAKLRDYIENGDNKLKLQPSIYGQIASALNAGKHLILIGPPGTGKTSLAHDICRYASDGKFTTGITFATASADWTTFDTVGGYVPTEQQTLQFRCGIFLQAICNGEWLVIDEINRAEIDKAFGELFTVLSGQQVDLPYKIGAVPVRVLPPKNRSLLDWVPNNDIGLSGYDYVIHPNWRIIGTMNVYDKSSLFNMSFAFMRRFAFIDVDLPDKETYETLVKNWAGGYGLPIEENGNEAPLLSTFREMLQRDNELMRFRALGPAIIRDMIAYVGDRFKSMPPPVPRPRMMELLAEAFLLYATPQLDGLEQSAIGAIYKLIDKWFGPLAEALGLLPRLRALYPHIRREEWDQ